MNGWQKLFLWLSISAFVLTCLFPPWHRISAIYRRGYRENLVNDTARHLLVEVILDKQWYPIWETEFVFQTAMDITKLRQAGFSKQEISDYAALNLSAQTAMDITILRQAGFSKQEISDYATREGSNLTTTYSDHYLITPTINWSFLILEWAIIWSIGIGAIITAKGKPLTKKTLGEQD
jgi:hypothetical protein